jgi:hypothetical protein
VMCSGKARQSVRNTGAGGACIVLALGRWIGLYLEYGLRGCTAFSGRRGARRPRGGGAHVSGVHGDPGAGALRDKQNA